MEGVGEVQMTSKSVRPTWASHKFNVLSQDPATTTTGMLPEKLV